MDIFSPNQLNIHSLEMTCIYRKSNLTVSPSHLRLAPGGPTSSLYWELPRLG